MSDAMVLDKGLLCQHYLEHVYETVNVKESLHSSKRNDIFETYGEILYASVEKLLKMVDWSEEDVFVDYGSGMGKIVTQVFLRSPVKEAIGIELLPELHEIAAAVSLKMAKELSDFYENGRKLTFVLGDFLQTTFPHATVAVVCAPCFPQPVLNALGRVLDETASIHTVFTLRPIATLKRLTFKRAVRVEGSWDTSLCYVYKAK